MIEVNQTYKCYTKGKPDIIVITSYTPKKGVDREIIIARRGNGVTDKINKNVLCELVNAKDYPEYFL